jgi:cytoskeleton protein RodZ
LEREDPLPSFGAKLKLAREKRAITLEQISISTKIGTRMLQALEADNFDQLPGGIFNKGFVRAYAKHVGLDEEQTLADYLVASGETVTPTRGAAHDADVVEDHDEKAPPWRTPLGWLAAGLLIVALGLTLWTRRQHNNNGSSPQPAPPPKSSNANQKPDSSPVSSGLSPKVTAAPAQSSATPPLQTTPADSNKVIPVDKAGGFTIVILASEESWVSIQVDDGPSVEDNLMPATQRVILGRKQVVIKAGNVGGLDFVFNGKKLPPQGDYGEVKTLAFGVTGLQPKSAAPLVSH